MTHYTGKDMYVSFGGVDISADNRSLTVNESVKTYDTTAGADTDESHVTGTKSATISMTILALTGSTGGSAIGAALVTGGTGLLQWGPEGTASGKPKYECATTITSNNPDYPYDGEVTFSVEFQKNGNWTYNYERSGSTY